jgi:hypothetical protein
MGYLNSRLKIIKFPLKLQKTLPEPQEVPSQYFTKFVNQ